MWILLNACVRGQVKSKLLVTNTQRKNKGTHYMDTKISQRYTVNKTKSSWKNTVCNTRISIKHQWEWLNYNYICQYGRISQT